MSIQLAAKHLAAHGRGPDTTLVHMTPGEVASLQSLAQQHGGSLTTNPHTGLPEAGFLSALLPMAAGAGLAAMGMPAGYAALAVGATSAATNGGDLRKGMLAGISAYGGAGMAGAFMDAGAATMGGNAGTSSVLQTSPGATSPYSLASSSTTPSTAGYSLGEPNSYLNQSLPSLVSTAPAEAAQAAAAATPAAQQATALQNMDMGQRFDALKAGASGTNAMNYIKANPFTSLGVGLAAMAPDDNKTPQKAADTDRGPRANMRYYPGYGTSLPKPNMQGAEQTFNRPYYAAKGGVTRMATGGITSAPRNQQQLFADYLQRVSNSGAAANGTAPPTNKYEWWKSSGAGTPAAAAPAETPEQYAARMSLNARGGGGGRTAQDEGATFKEPTSEQAYNWSQAGKNISTISPLLGGVVGAYGNYLARRVDPNYSHEARHSLSTPVGTEPAGGPIDYGPESGYMTNTDPYFSTQLGPGVGTPAYTAPEAKALDLGNTKSYIANETRYFSGVDGRAITKEQATKELSEGKNPITIRANDSLAQPNVALSRQERDVPGVVAQTNTTPASEAVGSYPAGSEARIAADVNAGRITNGSVIGVDGKNYTVNVDQGAGGMGASRVSLTPTGAQTNAALSLPSAVAQTNTKLDGVLPFNSSGTAGYPPVSQADQYQARLNAYLTGDNKALGIAPFSLPARESTTPEAQAARIAQLQADAVAQTNAALTPAETTPFDAFDFSGPTETAVQTAAQKDRIEAAREASIRADREAEAAKAEAARAYSPSELAGTSALNSAYGVADAKGDAYQGGFAPTVADSASIGPYASGRNSNYNEPTSGYSTVETQPIAAPDISPSVPGAISADPNADKKTETFGIPDAATFAAMIGAPFAQTAALNTGVVSDAGNGLAGIPAPNMGYYSNNQGGRGFGIPGLGSVLRSADGTPVRDASGTSWGTGESVGQPTSAETVDRIVREAQQANPGGGESQGPPDSRGDNNGRGVSEGGYSNSLTRSNDNVGGSQAAIGGLSTPYGFEHMARGGNVRGNMRPPAPFFQNGKYSFHPPQMYADGGMSNPYDLGSYSDGGRLLKGPGDGVSDSIPATIGKGRPARLADGEFVIPARIVSEIGNGSTEAGARKLYAMMDRIQAGRKKSVGKGKVAVNSRADKYLPA